MANPVERDEHQYTYGDYRTWPNDQRWELLDGEAYDMSPAPSRTHQRILVRLSVRFQSYLEEKTCEMYFAPFDVLLPEGDEADDNVRTVVQPDMVVVCDIEKLTEKGCRGAPDLVVEIISSYTGQKDLREKFSAYERAGVREYWVIYPLDKQLLVYVLGADGKYANGVRYEQERSVTVGILPELTVALADIFRD